MISRLQFWGMHSMAGVIIALAAFAADLLCKTWMIHVYDIQSRGRVEVTSYFDLVMLWNPGISFGQLPQDSAFGRYAIISLSIVVITALYFWMSQAASRLIAVSIALVIGGALGNLFDRIVYGAVADFFSFHYAGYYWYVFNIADAAITIGVIGLVVDWIFAPSHTKVSKNA